MPFGFFCLVLRLCIPHQYKLGKGDKSQFKISLYWAKRPIRTVTVSSLESPLDCKEIQSVYPKGDQSWIFIGRTDVKVEAPILWPSDAESWLTGKDPDAGKDWRQEEKGITEDEMVGWHHWLNGQEFEQAPGDGEVQGGWCAAVHGVAKSWTWQSDWTTYIHTYEK